MEKEIRISNNLNEIVVLASFIEELGEELSLPAETVMNINLALEEAVANIIMYAYPPKEQHIILLKVTSTEKQLIFLHFICFIYTTYHYLLQMIALIWHNR